MNLVKMFIYVFPSLIILSCNPTENPTLHSRWRLMKVEKLDVPLSSPERFSNYPSKPNVNEKPVFSFDSNYQIWSWNDSLRIEYTIIYKDMELYTHSVHSYELVRDTIHYTNARYNFQIIDNLLLLNGYGVSQFGRSNFKYYFELVE